MNQQKVKIDIAGLLQATLTPSRLLASGGECFMGVRPDSPGNLFVIESNDFVFMLKYEQGRFILRRNKYEVSVTVPSPLVGLCHFHFGWSPTSLSMSLRARHHVDEAAIETPLTFPPRSVIRGAQFLRHLPITTYPSAEAFRANVNDAFHSLGENIQRTGAISAFWDCEYTDRRLTAVRPKNETNIHPTLHGLLGDWALARGVEIEPESSCAVGRLDFALIGAVRDEGTIPICVEVKRAHAQDLLHGIRTQLPMYMENKRANFGVFVVLWFRGKWFDQPTNETIARLYKDGEIDVASVSDGDEDASSGIECDLNGLHIALQLLAPPNISVFVVDVTKPVVASKA